MMRVRKNLLARGYNATFSTTIALPPHALTLLAEALVPLIPSDAHSPNSILTDIKGRDATEELILPPAEVSSPTADELLFVAGRILDVTGGHTIPFQWRVSSRFLDFPSQTTIRHTVIHHRPAELPLDLPLSELPRSLPIELGWLRLGLEFFESSRLTAMLGMVTNVTQTLLIDASPTQCKISIACDHLPSRTTLPFATTPPQTPLLLERLSTALKSSLQYDLMEAFNKSELTP